MVTVYQLFGKDIYAEPTPFGELELTQGFIFNGAIYAKENASNGRDILRNAVQRFAADTIVEGIIGKEA